MSNTLVRVVDKGEIRGVKHLHSVVAELSERGYRKAIVAEKAPTISHWWALESEDGQKIIYCGTQATFKSWQNRGLQ